MESFVLDTLRLHSFYSIAFGSCILNYTSRINLCLLPARIVHACQTGFPHAGAVGGYEPQCICARRRYAAQGLDPTTFGEILPGGERTSL